MNKKAVPVPALVKGWWLRDRNGYLFGPYTDFKEIRGILGANRVGFRFATDASGLPCFEYVMEDWDGHRIEPDEWVTEQIELRRSRLRENWFNTYRRHVYRRGPVEGIGHAYGWHRCRNANLGRKVRDIGHGCVEDGEPPLRVKLRNSVQVGTWGDYPLRYRTRNWKAYRKHQWHD